MNYPANSVVIKLSRPFSLNGKEVTEITMREPTVKDKIMHDKAPGGPVEREVKMITSLCGLNPDDLDNLPAYDFEQLTGAFNRFLLPPADRENPTS